MVYIERNAMKLEVLLATMNQDDDSVLDEMAVTSNILVCNQNLDKTAYTCYQKHDYHVRWFDFQET
jgi:hypothetical protein